jgi:pimeloyl-ACP methyl ester carboxylesterase
MMRIADQWRKRVSYHRSMGFRISTMLLGMALLASVAQAAEDGRESFPSVRECEVGYRVYRPPQPTAGPTVLIAHGFMRDGEAMRGWAEAIAAAGLVAVTADLCASSVSGGRHADNATDLVALRKRLGARDVVYVGVSAGGLAALIAAAEDGDATRGLLLLDPTNAGGQARSAAARVNVPVAALVARPQVCNAWRNIDGALQTLDDVTIVPLARTSHCDFEWPTDRFCRIACLDTRRGHELAQRRIRRIGLAYLRAIAEDDVAALARWKGTLGAALADAPADEAAAPTTIR